MKIFRIFIGWPKNLVPGPLPPAAVGQADVAAIGRDRERRPIAETLSPPDDGEAVPSGAPLRLSIER